MLQQFPDSADVAGVVMGGEDRGTSQALPALVRENRPRIAGIDNHGVAFIAEYPDVVVRERGHGHGRDCITQRAGH